MELFGLILGAITTPLAWPIVLLILVAVSLMRGWIIPRSQSDALIDAHITIENNQSQTIELIRQERDKSLDAMTRERDLWREAANQSLAVAETVRAQNGDLIKRQESIDHLITELRQLTGIGGDKDGG